MTVLGRIKGIGDRFWRHLTWQELKEAKEETNHNEVEVQKMQKI